MLRKKYKYKKIAVLYGGWSHERQISIQTGKAILNSLVAQGLDAFGIDLTVDKLSELDKKNMDIAYIALHGRGGEDGFIQSYLDMKNIPYTGSNALSSAIAMNKYYTKKILDSEGIPTAKYEKFDLNLLENKQDIKFQQKLDSIYDIIDFPFVIKPNSQGSAIGVYIVNTKDEFLVALENVKKYDIEAIIEKYIKGREFTVGIINDTILPVLEIISANFFYDFEAKYQEGKSRHLIPEDLDSKILEKIQFFAKKTHEALGCRGASRVDIIMDEFKNLYVLEINTIPGMTKTSLLPDAAEKIGISFDELVLKILDI